MMCGWYKGLNSGVLALLLSVSGGLGVTSAIAQSPSTTPQPNETEAMPSEPFDPPPSDEEALPGTVEPDTPEVSPSPKPQPQQTPNQPKPQSTNQRKAPPPDQFPPNPLEITEPDPLIPYNYKERPLTARERKDLSDAADRLVLIGFQRMQAGDRVGAFDAWNRELRYRRLLGPLAKEVQALGRVGDVAWTQNNQTQLRYITNRLDQILALARKPQAERDRDAAELANPARRLNLLEALGLAYQQVRVPKVAASIYEELLGDARKRQDSIRIEAALLLIGQLHLGQFDYAKAATAYQELLERAQARNDSFNIPIYLNQLAYIHEQAKQFAQAIPYQQQLVDFHQTAANPVPIPALVNKIADNHRRLGQLDQAEAKYQLAYKLAQPQLQFAVAGDALKKLGELYRANDRLDAAKRIYTFLVTVEQQGYNTYGVMDAYDQLGQIYLLEAEYPQAIAAFQRGLIIARQLKYREDYFTTQIQKATEQGETPSPQAAPEATEEPEKSPN